MVVRNEGGARGVVALRLLVEVEDRRTDGRTASLYLEINADVTAILYVSASRARYVSCPQRIIFNYQPPLTTVGYARNSNSWSYSFSKRAQKTNGNMAFLLLG